MLKEGIHERLADVYNEFDRHSQITNTKYSIDADYFDMQGYRVMDCSNFQGFLKHIANYVKDRQIDMEVNGTKLKYDNLFDPDFRLKQSEQPIFKFTLGAIQENGLSEMQRRSPTTAHTVKQSQFRASIRPNKPGFQYGNTKKKKRIKKPMNDSFESRLDSILSENISFSEPEVLFTKDSGIAQELSPHSYLANAKESMVKVLDQCHFALKGVDNPSSIAMVNDTIENISNQIETINKLIGELNGTAAS